jgi:hypothetical protein
MSEQLQAGANDADRVEEVAADAAQLGGETYIFWRAF